MKKLLTTIALILFLAAGAFAQSTSQPKLLTLSRAVEIALELNPTVRQAQNNLEREQASVLSSYGNFLPSIGVSSDWRGNSGESFLPDGQKLPSTNVRSFSSSIGASMTVFDGFSNTSTLSQASSNAISSEFGLSRTRQNVVYQTRRLFYEVLRTRRLLEVAESSLKYNQQQLERVQETARLGSASLVNVYQQQSQVGQDEVRLVQAQNDYDNARANLVAYIGLDVTETYTIEDSTIPTELTQLNAAKERSTMQEFRRLVETALGSRLDYQASKENYYAAESGVTIARSGYYPRITASTSYGLSGNNRTISEFDDFKNTRSFNWGLSLSFPIFSGFRTNQAEQAALVTKKNSEVTLQDTERKIQVELRSALLQLEFAEKNYDAAVKSLQYQEQNLKVNQEKYNVGSGTILDLLFAQNNYNSALTSKINAVYQYLSAKSNLELALGSIQQ